MIPTFVYELPTGEEKEVILSLDLGKQSARAARSLSFSLRQLSHELFPSK
jgi:hexokinase